MDFHQSFHNKISLPSQNYTPIPSFLYFFLSFVLLSSWLLGSSFAGGDARLGFFHPRWLDSQVVLEFVFSASFAGGGARLGFDFRLRRWWCSVVLGFRLPSWWCSTFVFAGGGALLCSGFVFPRFFHRRWLSIIQIFDSSFWIVRISVMSISEDDRSFSAEYEALAIVEAEEKAYYEISKEVLETMSNYSSPSDGRVPSNMDLWEWYRITPPGSPTSHMSPSFLQAEVSYEQAMVKEAQDQNEALQVQLMASEG